MSGKIPCKECKTPSSLSEIVNKDMIKGNYICKDCATMDENFTYFESTPTIKNLNDTKLNKLFKWAFGVGEST